MTKLVRTVFVVLGLALAGAAPAQESAPPAPTQQEVANTAAAAAIAAKKIEEPRTPDFLEHLVDAVLEAFDVRNSGNTTSHYVIAALFIVGFYVLRRVVTTVVFGVFRRAAARTKTTLDDKLFGALEPPVATFFVLLGIFSAIKVLKLSEAADNVFGYAATVAFSLNFFWLLLRAFNAVLDHLQQVATEKKAGVAAFMPWIKKTLITIFVIFGVLMIAQSLGADVKAFLAGLGIGGLAFALAAQDTIANLFGSVVVAIDQPFKLGDFVQIGANSGAVEDIGLRSTRLRRADKALIVIPNKTVAAEAVTNLSRFTQRRFEQVIGLTYSASPDDLHGIVEDIRGIILAEREVDAGSVMVFFRDFSASSLDLWVVYLTLDPDFAKSMALKQRINLAIMRAVAARGLSFAFPSQSVYLEGDVARQLAARRENAPAAPASGAPPTPPAALPAPKV